MGTILSRLNQQLNNHTEDETDTTSNYKYPPKSGKRSNFLCFLFSFKNFLFNTGNFFGNSFIMGGERFDQTVPESYLFGENSDLNWLGSKPIAVRASINWSSYWIVSQQSAHPFQFPYLPPKNSEPTKTLKSLVNIRKESVKFVKTSDEKFYNIEFTFDADHNCTITIYYFCTEEITTNKIAYVPRDVATSSETFYYQKGISVF